MASYTSGRTAFLLQADGFADVIWAAVKQTASGVSEASHPLATHIAVLNGLESAYTSNCIASVLSLIFISTRTLGIWGKCPLIIYRVTVWPIFLFHIWGQLATYETLV
jgi:hypothetical protein